MNEIGIEIRDSLNVDEVDSILCKTNKKGLFLYTYKHIIQSATKNK